MLRLAVQAGRIILTLVLCTGLPANTAFCLTPALHSCRRSDYFETLEECALLPGCLPVGLGPGCTARRCIIDKNARIGANVQIVNKDGVQVRR